MDLTGVIKPTFIPAIKPLNVYEGEEADEGEKVFIRFVFYLGFKIVNLSKRSVCTTRREREREREFSGIIKKIN